MGRRTQGMIVIRLPVACLPTKYSDRKPANHKAGVLGSRGFACVACERKGACKGLLPLDETVGRSHQMPHKCPPCQPHTCIQTSSHRPLPFCFYFPAQDVREQAAFSQVRGAAVTIIGPPPSTLFHMHKKVTSDRSYGKQVSPHHPNIPSV